ncbi:hypothetical protein SAMN05428949_2113 [Chitinophaga sp. YR627]|nr:hypothetical protein SAMN05428949_2113 [Chitinophaga sp. YR627]
MAGLPYIWHYCCRFVGHATYNENYSTFEM